MRASVSLHFQQSFLISQNLTCRYHSTSFFAGKKRWWELFKFQYCINDKGMLMRGELEVTMK